MKKQNDNKKSRTIQQNQINTNSLAATSSKWVNNTPHLVCRYSIKHCNCSSSVRHLPRRQYRKTSAQHDQHLYLCIETCLPRPSTPHPFEFHFISIGRTEHGGAIQPILFPAPSLSLPLRIHAQHIQRIWSPLFAI